MLSSTAWGTETDDTVEKVASEAAEEEPILYSLQHALQDFALVFLTTTGLFVLLILSGASRYLLGWAEAYPQLQITELFLYAILITVGFGVASLRRWMQLTTVAREQEQTKRELKRKADALKRSNQELERFAYAASHDLREPLRMVHSYLSLLERELDTADLSEDAHEFLDEARGASRRMDHMVRSVLEYARLDPDREPDGPTDPGEALDEAIENLRMRLDAHDVTLDRGDLPRVLGRTDELVVVFQNLLQNALTHGGPELSMIEIDGWHEDGEAVIEIRDDGHGIEPGQQERIFEIFQQGRGSSTTAGAGMGLALCRRIAEGHGGEISVDSERGEGATFRIELPATQAQEGSGPTRAVRDRSLAGA